MFQSGVYSFHPHILKGSFLNYGKLVFAVNNLYNPDMDYERVKQEAESLARNIVLSADNAVNSINEAFEEGGALFENRNLYEGEMKNAVGAINAFREIVELLCERNNIVVDLQAARNFLEMIERASSETDGHFKDIKNKKQN